MRNSQYIYRNNAYNFLFIKCFINMRHLMNIVFISAINFISKCNCVVSFLI